MSLIDKVVAAVAPPSDKSRQEARAKAQACAQPGDWLSAALQHHMRIESAFEAVKSANTAAERQAAHRQLMLIFIGHSDAEEAVLYPAMVRFGEKGSATMSYTEHSGAKANLAELEYLDPMSQDYLDKLEHVRSAVARHVYEEEGSRFPELKEKATAADQTRLTQRFLEEFERYMGSDGMWTTPEGVGALRQTPPPPPAAPPFRP
jgi:hemerythrin superfamily protein